MEYNLQVFGGKLFTLNLFEIIFYILAGIVLVITAILVYKIIKYASVEPEYESIITLPQRYYMVYGYKDDTCVYALNTPELDDVMLAIIHAINAHDSDKIVIKIRRTDEGV